ncbi:hypothetical protein, partial [Bacteroides uniformis]|uniref:hypothetical protein n=1 Tax=Bacteroides uniformis TaxID=820 RepID=UPI001EDC9818
LNCPDYALLTRLVCHLSTKYGFILWADTIFCSKMVKLNFYVKRGQHGDYYSRNDWGRKNNAYS